jgi:hypothetical protein
VRTRPATDEERAYWERDDAATCHPRVLGGPHEGDGVIPCPVLMSHGPHGHQVHVVYELDPVDEDNLRRGGHLWFTTHGGLPVHRVEVLPPELPVPDELPATDSNGDPATIVLGHDPGVRHQGCEHLADISPHLDSVYCSHCGYTNRISGEWFIRMQHQWYAAQARAWALAPADPVGEMIVGGGPLDECSFMGVVTDAGGGAVTIIVDRATEHYPPEGTRVACLYRAESADG